MALVSLWLGIMWVANIKPMDAPDEPAYLQAVMETRNKRMLPEIHFDFSKNTVGELTGAPGDPAARTYAMQHGINDAIRLAPYQNSQPPLYFLVAGPVAMLLPPDPQTILYASRLISALFGAGTVFFCWAAVRELAPRQPMWAVGVTGVIALLPEFCFNNARASNDSLVNCLGAASFYIWFRGLRQPEYDPWLLRAGAIVGLALLAKLTAVALLPGLALLVLFRAFQTSTSAPSELYNEHNHSAGSWTAPKTTHSVSGIPHSALKRGVRMAVGAAGAALAVCGWWLVRNLIAYGDLTGSAGVNRFYAATLQVPGFNLATRDQQADFVESTWKSFWGYYGWQNIAMPDSYYLQAGFFTQVLFGLSGLAALLLLVRRLGKWRHSRDWEIMPAHARQAAVMLSVVGVALVVAFVQYSLVVAKAAQGRYLFLMLLPAAMLFTGGLYALPPRPALKVLALCIPLLWLATMNFVGLLTVK